MVYLLLLIYCLICTVLYQNTKRKSMLNCQLLLLYIVTVLLFGLRYRVGIDSLRYIDHYEELPNLFQIKVDDLFETEFAPLFVCLFSLCKTISNDFCFFQIVHAIIVNGCIFYFARTRSENPFLTLFFYYIIVGILFNTEILRESLAVGVFLLNFENVKKKKWVKYYVISIFILGLHYSAIITLLVPLFAMIKFNKTLLLYLGGYIIIVYGLMQFIDKVGIPIEVLAARYSEQTSFKESHDVSLYYYIATLIKSTLFVFVVLFYNRRYCIVQNEKIEPMIIVFSIVATTGVFYPLIFDRFSNYFVLFFIVSLSNCIYEMQVKKNVVYICFFLVISCFFMYLNLKKSNLERYYPYHSVLMPEKELVRERMHLYGI